MSCRNAARIFGRLRTCRYRFHWIAGCFPAVLSLLAAGTTAAQLLGPGAVPEAQSLAVEYPPGGDAKTPPLVLSYTSPASPGLQKVGVQGQPDAWFDIHLQGELMGRAQTDKTGASSFLFPAHTPGETLALEVRQGEQTAAVNLVVKPYPVEVRTLVKDRYLTARVTADEWNYGDQTRCPNGWKKDGSSRCTKDAPITYDWYWFALYPWHQIQGGTEKTAKYTLTIKYRNEKEGGSNFLEIASDVSNPDLLEYDQPVYACLTGMDPPPPCFDTGQPLFAYQPDQADVSLCTPIGQSGTQRLETGARTLSGIRLFYYSARTKDGFLEEVQRDYFPETTEHTEELSVTLPVASQPQSPE